MSKEMKNTRTPRLRLHQAQAVFDELLQHIQQARAKAFTILGGQKLSPVARVLHPYATKVFKDNYIPEFSGGPIAKLHELIQQLPETPPAQKNDL